MARADSVPTAISRPITGATMKASKKDARRHWSELITGGMPIGTYVVTAFYATAVILVGYAPWNILLVLALLLSRDDVLRYAISSRWGRSYDREAAERPSLFHRRIRCPDHHGRG